MRPAKFFLSLCCVHMVVLTMQYLLAIVIGGWSAILIAFILSGIYLHFIAEAGHLVHHNFRRSRVANMLTNRLLFLTDAAASYHWLHHKHLGSEEDPDFCIYGNPPVTRRGVIMRFVKTALIVAGLLNKHKVPRNEEVITNDATIKSNYLEIIAGQLVILALYSVFIHWTAYFVLWIGALGVAKAVNDIRVFIEHFPSYGGPAVTIRNFQRHGLIEKTIGAFGFVDHAHHHAKPGSLPEKLALMQDPPGKTRQGYIASLVTIIRSYPA